MIDKFSKFGRTLPLRIKNAQTTKVSFENIVMSSTRKPNLIETDRGKEFYNNIFQNFPYKNNINFFSSNSSLGAVFAERFNCTVGDLLKKVVFERREVNRMMFYLQ